MPSCRSHFWDDSLDQGTRRFLVAVRIPEDSMKKLIIVLICLATNASLSQTHASHIHHSSHPQANSVEPQYDGTPGSVTGYVRDIACLLRNSKASAATTPETRSCLRQCIASGSPIGILA